MIECVYSGQQFKQNLSFPRTAERHEGWRFGMPLEDAWGYVG